MLRDVLLNRAPVILEREIHALTALAGAGIEVTGQHLAWFSSGRTRGLCWLLCSALRFCALHVEPAALPHTTLRALIDSPNRVCNGAHAEPRVG